MAVTTQSKQLVEAQIAAAGILYKAPDDVIATIQAAMICNTTGGTITCTVYITGDGIAVGNGNTFLKSVDVVANDTYLCPELIGQKVSPKHEIHINAAGVTFAVAGVEVKGQT